MPAKYKLFIAVTGALSTLVMFGLAFAGRHAERRHLLRHGARVQGHVIAIDAAGDTSRSAPVLRYRFVPAGRTEPVEGRCTVNVFVPYRAGDAAVICYNRSHPVSSLILSPGGRPL